MKSKKDQGFVLIFLLPFVSVLMTAFIGASIMSIGIKNITRAKTTCILHNLELQKDLSKSLQRLLKLNGAIKALHKAKQALKATLILGIVTLQPKVIFSLYNKIKMINKGLKATSLAQKIIIMKAEALKIARISKFKTAIKLQSISLVSAKSSKRKSSFFSQLKSFVKTVFTFKLDLSVKKALNFKPALAVKKVKLGKHAFIYKIKESFEEEQKITLTWSMKPFLNFYKHSPSQYQCTSTLERRSKKWMPRLYH